MKIKTLEKMRRRVMLLEIQGKSGGTEEAKVHLDKEEEWEGSVREKS